MNKASREAYELCAKGEYPMFVHNLAKRDGVDLDDRDAMLMGALGLAGEAGEVADMIKKVVFHGKDMDKDALALEMGDVLWYFTHIANRVLDMDLWDIMALNVDKLAQRYASGGFTTAESIAKADER